MRTAWKLIERIHRLLTQLEWCRMIRDGRTPKRIETCPSCHRSRYDQGAEQGGHAFLECELKACLDELAKIKEGTS